VSTAGRRLLIFCPFHINHHYLPTLSGKPKVNRFIQNQTHLSVQPQITPNSTTPRLNVDMVQVDRDCRSAKMAHTFDCQARFSAWRKLWLYLAQSQKQMGVALITDKAIEQMKNNLFITDSDLREASKRGNASTREVSVTFRDIRPLANNY
jgi:hypothetical protein